MYRMLHQGCLSFLAPEQNAFLVLWNLARCKILMPPGEAKCNPPRIVCVFVVQEERRRVVIQCEGKPFLRRSLCTSLNGTDYPLDEKELFSRSTQQGYFFRKRALSLELFWTNCVPFSDLGLHSIHFFEKHYRFVSFMLLMYAPKNPHVPSTKTLTCIRAYLRRLYTFNLRLVQVVSPFGAVEDRVARVSRAALY